jgi:Capsular polysaccharide biosynthesis protein
LLNPAKLPTEPSSKSLPFVIVFALFVGTFLGLALIFVAEFLDRRIRSETDLTDTLGLPVLVTINAIAPPKRKGLPDLSNRQRPQLN